MEKRRKSLIILFTITIIAFFWWAGDQKTGLGAANRKVKNQANVYLQEHYPDMKYKIKDVGFSSPARSIATLKIETNVDSLPIQFHVTLTNKGEISDDYENVLISEDIKRKISPLIHSIIPENALDVATVRSGTEYYPYVYILWEDTLSEEEFLNKALSVRDALIAQPITIDLIRFTCAGKKNNTFYQLRLGTKEMEYTKEKILEEKILNP